jgi:hypothetical protein
MLSKQTLLLALLVPALALVSACKRNDTSDTAPATAADTGTPPPAAMPAAEPAPTPAPADSMGSDTATVAAETPFADLDKNHDGSLTKDELPPGEMLGEHFSAADTNGDGKLSEAEVAKHRADMAGGPGKP